MLVVDLLVAGSRADLLAALVFVGVGVRELVDVGRVTARALSARDVVATGHLLRQRCCHDSSK
jgi:hypothetical protein